MNFIDHLIDRAATENAAQPRHSVTPLRNLSADVSRRDFLRGMGISSSGLILASVLPGSAIASLPDTQITQPAELNLFVSIGTDNQVHLVCHRSEMGQGIRTGIVQVIADELEADWDQVNVVQGLADARYGSQNTDGSRSIRRFYHTMREMGASARMMLEQAAAKTWQIETAHVYAQRGKIYNRKTNQAMTFGELSSLAATMQVPEKTALQFKKAQDFRFIGKPVALVDMAAIQTGETEFGQDVHLDNMLYACIARPPVVGAAIESVNTEVAKSVREVVDVWQLPIAKPPFAFQALGGVAVLANNTWAAMQGREKLQIAWGKTPYDDHNSDSYLQTLRSSVLQKGKVKRSRGDGYQAFDTSAHQIEASYSIPYLIAAPMEPPAATAVFQNGTFEIWACTQTPQATQKTVATIMGVEPEKVKVHVTLLGGGFGRKSKPDFSVEAAMLAKQFGRPVKVVWTREDDVQHSFYHAISAQHIKAGMDKDKNITSWIHRTAFPSISWTFNGTSTEPSDGELSLGFGDLPFDIANLSMETQSAPANMRIGWIRAVSNIQHAFAIGSFVDELAVAKQQSTYQTWLELIGSDRKLDVSEDGFTFDNYGESLENFPADTKRLKAVLTEVIDRSGAQDDTAEDEGWGIAVHRSFVSYVAVACKVKVMGSGSNVKLQLLELHCAMDAGTVVNPDRVKAQMEGGMTFGASLALMGDIRFENGKVVQSNYHDYPVLRMHQNPKMYTYIIRSDDVPGGVGEPGTPPTAAAITNAIFHASGKRIRDLPVSQYLSV